MKGWINDLFLFRNLRWQHWVVIFAAYIILHIPAIHKNSYDTNLAIFQAKAFTEGKLDIGRHFWDASFFEGKYYVCFPPLTSVLLIPAAALFGTDVNTIAIALLITCLSMYLLYRLLAQLMGDSPGKLWVFLAFFFGSGYWWVVLTSDYINGFAHVVCISLLFAMLLELLGKKRPLLLGLLWALVFLTRQMTIFYGLLIIYFLYVDQPDKRIAVRNIAVAGLVALACVTPYFLFNYVRFHDVLDTGYRYLAYSIPIHERISEHGLFSFKYFFFNFYHLLLKGHNIIFSGAMNLDPIAVDEYGTSVLAASPYVIFSYKAQAGTGFKWAFWITILLILFSILLYHNNGWIQVNTQRFALDFFPALIVLIALSYKHVPSWLFKSFVAYAIALNCMSYYIHSFS